MTHLGHSNDNDLAIMFFHQIVRQVRGLGIGIVATNRVNDVNAILEQLLRRHFERRAVGGTVALFDAVFDVGELEGGVVTDGSR